MPGACLAEEPLDGTVGLRTFDYFAAAIRVKN